MYRKTYLEINEDYLKNNVENIILNYPKYDYYFGVVKANAYGHGEHIVDALIEGGVNYLAVSSLDEAISVRKYNKDIPILCFGYINPANLDVAIKNNITITIVSYEYFKELINAEGLNGLKAHLKLNTGMNRIGVGTKEEVKEIIDSLKKSDIELEGIYTHYATSGVLDIYWDKQTSRFEELTSLINLNEIKIVHLYNSLSLVKHDKLKYANGVRLGVVMYGYSSSVKEPTGIREKIFETKKYFSTHGQKISKTNMSNELKLRKAMNLYSEVVSINYVHAKEPVGYKAIYIPDKDTFVATVCIGHADGVTKYYEYVKINDKKYPIVALCMDAIMVRVDDTVKVHDKVLLVGDDISMATIANDSEISIHQALVSISNRVPRVYIRNGKKEEIRY